MTTSSGPGTGSGTWRRSSPGPALVFTSARIVGTARSLPDADDRIALAGPTGRLVHRVEVDDEPLVERVLRVDLDAVVRDDVVVLEPDAELVQLAVVRLDVEDHVLAERDRLVLRGRREERRLPRVD